MIPKIPKMKPGLIVISPTDQVNITANKKYVVEGLLEDEVIIRNDEGRVGAYSAYRFIEVDLYFTMCLFGIFTTLFK